MQIIIVTKAKVGDIVYVENYRSPDRKWEKGKVTKVDVEIFDEKAYRISYAVTLDRTTKEGWKIQLAAAGQEQIRLIPREPIQPDKPWPKK